jgi:hypothetical protein
MVTKYEIAAEKNGKRFTVAFTARKTARCLVQNVMGRGQEIVKAVDADETATCVKADRNEVVMSDGTRIFFTGLTELDVKGR